MRTRGEDFDQFVATAAPRLLRSAVALTGSRDVADDLVQDVLERLYIAWPRVEDPVAYANRALVNRSRNRWRQRARHPEVLVGRDAERASADGTVSYDSRDELVRGLAALPHRQRAVLVLRYVADLSEVDTARALSCSVGTIKSQTARALERLRSLMRPDGDPAQLERRAP